MDKTKAVIFDMDGVLTDSEPLINMAAIKMFEELGLKVKPEDFHPFIGTGEERYIGGVAEKYNFPLDLKTAKKRTYEIYLELVPPHLKPFPGAVEFVKQCRTAGLKTALASSADLIKITANLNKIGLPVDEWNCIVSAEDVARRNPAPDIFLKAAEKLDLHPQECVVIEDAVNGIQAAKAAGIPCIAVCHTFPKEKLKDADIIVETIDKLTHIFLTLTTSLNK
ncbi:MAG: HAD-IA family hydrolase [Verrucomicrobiae bacterium]|nr:HAD-IA family hydrolase [Verrucomicrobiae bacterium]